MPTTFRLGRRSSPSAAAAERSPRAILALVAAVPLACGESAVEARAAESGGAQVDPALSAYEEVSGLGGSIRSVGSDTMLNAITLWSRRFAELYPEVAFEIEGKGSATGPPALLSGAADVAPMSRPMSDGEVAEFAGRYGYPPTGLAIAVDGIAVFVHKDNPIDRLTLAQVDAIFSASRRCGGPEAIEGWGQLVRIGDWASAPIERYGSDSLSGMRGFFRTNALCEGEFRADVTELLGSASVVHEVAQDRFAIGYAGLAYRSPGVKALALARSPGQPYYTWETSQSFASDYPLARRLYVYVNKPPRAPLPPLVREFLRFGLSREGQQLVGKDGLVPLKAEVADAELAKLVD